MNERHGLIGPRYWVVNVQKIFDSFTTGGKHLALGHKGIEFRNTKNPMSKEDMLYLATTTKNCRETMLLISKRKRSYSRLITQRVPKHKQQSRQQPMFQPIVRLLTSSIPLFRHNVLHKGLTAQKFPSASNSSLQSIQPSQL